MISIKRIASKNREVLALYRVNFQNYVKVWGIVRRTVHGEAPFDAKVEALRDKLIHSDYLHREIITQGFMKRKIRRKNEALQQKIAMMRKLTDEPALSVVLDSRNENDAERLTLTKEREQRTAEKSSRPVHMPYSSTDSYRSIESPENDAQNQNSVNRSGSDTAVLNEEYTALYEKYLEAKNSIDGSKDQKDLNHTLEQSIPTTVDGDLSRVPANWMTDYEQFDDTLLEEDLQSCFGTADPNVDVSSIPCGGCGALLHCKDPSIPGYLPTELFLNQKEDDLKRVSCQRCHFLQFYNTALRVKVSPEEYPELLKVIKRKMCTVILMIDLTDFPCSIWPDIKSVLHPLTTVFLVGSKVDLLPRDSSDFLSRVKDYLSNTVQDITGIAKKRIVHVELVSAKTGYGIEPLINKLQSIWGTKGDVYLIGCTNVGKSSLFNRLLHSDYCKAQAVDLVQRATISPWPGTTLNLLKFPILKLTKEKKYLRLLRLKAEQPGVHLEERYGIEQYKNTRNIRHVTFRGNVGKTFSYRTLNNLDFMSNVSADSQTGKPTLDETRPEYIQSRWCYDTPGTVQREQILDILTTEELMSTLPREVIVPRTFILKPEQTVFVAGIGRIDLLKATNEDFIRCTLFANKTLPLTICHTIDADHIYQELLETEAFVVPVNNPERLKVWPSLKPKEMRLEGVNETESAGDVVLSNAGWIAITPHENQMISFKAWTPDARGLYLRMPALLKKSVSLRGARIPMTPLYRRGRQVYFK